MTRWLFIVMLGAGCGGGAASAPRPAVAPPSQPGDTTADPAGTPSPDSEGTHVAAEVVYQGDCAPPGTRGGCHSITLHPDGRYTEWLYDAVTGGTYTISGDTVTLTGSDPALNRTLTFSADRDQLGELTRKQ